MALITGSRTTSIIDSLRDQSEDISELVTEMQKNPIVQLIERVFKANAKSASVSFTPRVQTPQVTALAAILEDRWNKSMAMAMDAVAFGWQAFELAPSISKGVAYPGEIVPLPHSAIDPSEIEISGGKVRSVTVKGAKGDTVKLGRPYVWVATVQRSALKPLGVSQFTGAVEQAWRAHKELLKRRDTFARKNATGNTIIRAPKWETRSENGTDIQVDVHAEISQAVAAMDGGDLLILGCDRVMKSDGSEGEYKIDIEREGGECKDAGPLIALIDSCADELLLAAGIPPKTLVEGDGVGSFALVSQQMIILMNRIEELFSAVFESYGEFVVEEYAYLATGRRNAIEYTFTPIAERPDDMGREIVKSIMTSPQLSPFVMSGAVDVAAMLRSQGIPITDKFASELAKLKMQPSPVPTAVGLSLPKTFINGVW